MNLLFDNFLMWADMRKKISRHERVVILMTLGHSLTDAITPKRYLYFQLRADMRGMRYQDLRKWWPENFRKMSGSLCLSWR